MFFYKNSLKFFFFNFIFLFFLIVAIFFYTNIFTSIIYVLVTDNYFVDSYNQLKSEIKWVKFLWKSKISSKIYYLNLINYSLYLNYMIFFLNLKHAIIFVCFNCIPLFFTYLSIILIQIFLLILTIWTRACGPRVRIDQILTLTWKEFLIYLFILMIFIIFIYILI